MCFSLAERTRTARKTRCCECGSPSTHRVSEKRRCYTNTSGEARCWRKARRWMIRSTRSASSGPRTDELRRFRSRNRSFEAFQVAHSKKTRGTASAVSVIATAITCTYTTIERSTSAGAEPIEGSSPIWKQFDWFEKSGAAMNRHDIFQVLTPALALRNPLLKVKQTHPLIAKAQLSVSEMLGFCDERPGAAARVNAKKPAEAGFPGADAERRCGTDYIL